MSSQFLNYKWTSLNPLNPLNPADLMQTTRLLFGIMVLSGMGVSFA